MPDADNEMEGQRKNFKGADKIVNVGNSTEQEDVNFIRHENTNARLQHQNNIQRKPRPINACLAQIRVKGAM